jgi:hypothetical protein
MGLLHGPVQARRPDFRAHVPVKRIACSRLINEDAGIILKAVIRAKYPMRTLGYSRRAAASEGGVPYYDDHDWVDIW